MSQNGWSPATREHTFRSGRTATLLATLPMLVLARRAIARGDLDLVDQLDQLEQGKVENAAAALAIQDAIVQAMWRHPRVALPGERVGATPEDEIISIEDLVDDEITETVELARAEVRDAATFRDDADGAGDGANGAGVAEPAKRPARPRKRKPGGVPA